jgi:DHA2 family multidrug resistance protein
MDIATPHGQYKPTMDPSETPPAIPMKPGARNILTLCLMLATLMQVLDSTIANVALPYMQGSLSASYDQITWVLTSYIATMAVCVAPVGWLAARFGRRPLLIACILGFTVTSMLCGVAASLTQMVVYRALQGMFGAALVPLSQSTMLDIFTLKQRGSAMALWGMGVMVGPILGPTLGGWLTAAFDWRYVFFVNLPVGALALVGMLFYMPKENASRHLKFDWTGFAVLSVALGALQIGLDRGEELDWLNSTFIITCLVLCCAGFYLFFVHMLTAETPFIPRSLFKDRTFDASLLGAFSIGMTLLASSALLAPYLETLSNYPVAQAGLVMSPRGAGTIGAMLLVGQLNGKIDPRLLLTFGNIVMLGSFWSMTGWTPDVSATTIMLTLLIQGAAMAFVFSPLQVLAFDTLPGSLRTQGASVLYLVRTVGSAIGISLTSAILDHATRTEHSVLAGYITPFTRPLQTGTAGAAMLNLATPHGAALMDSIINTQAQIIAYADDYKFLLLISLPATLSVLLMSKPRNTVAAEPGEAVMD